MPDLHHSFWLVVVMAAVTFLLRAIPFWVLGAGRTIHPAVTYLGKVLPYAIIGMLVVYCLKGITFRSAPYGLPELLASAVVVLLHMWRRNTLLSVGAGTVCYMLLIRFLL